MRNAQSLSDWVEEMSELLDELLGGFEDRFGYPPDDNVVTRAEPGECAALEVLASVVDSHDLLEFYSHVKEISLPDVQNGLFVDSAEVVVDGANDGQPTRVTGAVEDSIIVIGSDGGGRRFAWSYSTGNVVRLQGGALVGSTYEVGPGGIDILANDVAAFLQLLHEAVRNAVHKA